MSSPKVNFPKPTDQEKALQQQQIDILNEQRGLLRNQARQQDLLAPFLYEQLGLTPIRDAVTNEIINFERTPNPAATEQETLRADIERRLLERSRDALEGNLPVDPALERELATGETRLREQLLQQLGPGFETSSPGIESLGEFARRASELRSGARTGQLSLSEGLSLARDAEGFRNRQARLQNLGQIPSFNLPTIGAGLGVASGFGGTLGQLAAERDRQFQARLFNAQQPTLFENIYGIAYDTVGLASSFTGGGGGGATFGNRSRNSSGGGGGGFGGGLTLGSAVFG